MGSALLKDVAFPLTPVRSAAARPASNSLAGLIGHGRQAAVDWPLTGAFLVVAIVGMLAGNHLASRVPVAALKQGDAPLVLDVRTSGEWAAGHIEEASHIPLPNLLERMDECPKDEPLAIICGSGYRSTIAASLLMRAGFTRLQNVMGGMRKPSVPSGGGGSGVREMKPGRRLLLKSTGQAAYISGA